MLMILGFAGTAVFVALVMGILCLVWRCCPCHSRSRPTPHPTQAKTVAGSEAGPARWAPQFSRTHSFEARASVDTAPKSGEGATFSPPSKTVVTEAAVVADGPATRTSSPPFDTAPTDAAALPPAAAEATVGPLLALRDLGSSPPPEDIFVAVTSDESPSKRMRRHRSIASHMEVGFSHDESVRLHLMRHADTSDPVFGAFVKSSRAQS
jgi:hypothetical protein